MGLGLIGKKLGMTQVFDENGRVVPVTVIESEPNAVIQVKTKQKDGYTAVQLGYGEAKEKQMTRPVAGHFKKVNQKIKKVLREFRIKEGENFTVGQEIKVDLFKQGDYVDITGVSIGKGFQGGVKRWHWSGGPGAHGSTHHRAPGSIGSSSDPSRVFKGHHLPGRMGGDVVTVQSLKVVKVDLEKNAILVKGAVPGSDNGILIINKAKKKISDYLKPKAEKKVDDKKKADAKPKPAAKKPEEKKK